jgi:hypothetical protein
LIQLQCLVGNMVTCTRGVAYPVHICELVRQLSLSLAEVGKSIFVSPFPPAPGNQIKRNFRSTSLHFASVLFHPRLVWKSQRLNCLGEEFLKNGDGARGHIVRCLTGSLLLHASPLHDLSPSICTRLHLCLPIG